MLENKMQIMTNVTSSARICVDDYNGGEMQGRLYHAYLEEPLVFHNVVALLKLLGSLFDSYDFPQVSMKSGSFKPQDIVPKDYLTEKVVIHTPTQYNRNMMRGKKGTFWIRVLFRQNATWQGNIKWVEEGSKANFRSALELIMLLDSCFDNSRALVSSSDLKREKII